MLFGIFARNSQKRPLLSVALDGTEICVIRKAPSEEKPSVKLSSRTPILTFTDSSGREYSHDLASVVAEGFSWIHLSVRVHDGYARELRVQQGTSVYGDWGEAKRRIRERTR